MQVYAVHTGIGTIDRMKRRRNPLGHQPIPWSHVFGNGTVLLWPLPTAPYFKRRAKVLGFKSSGGSAGDDEGSGDEGEAAPLV